MKQTIIWTIVLIAVLFGSTWLTKSLQKKDGTVLSASGIHWHPLLSIYMDGQKVEIPANIGLSGVHMAIHTHDDSTDLRETSGVTGGYKPLHLEFGSAVREDDVRLGNFFRIWGKEFSSECLMDKCVSEDGGFIRMMVNGKENTLFENYVMRDGDRIEIFYESESN